MPEQFSHFYGYPSLLPWRNLPRGDCPDKNPRGLNGAKIIGPWRTVLSWAKNNFYGLLLLCQKAGLVEISQFKRMADKGLYLNLAPQVEFQG